MKNIPESDVVITNPTHYAVALRFREGIDIAPKVTVKGIDHVALQIKKIARKNRVPIIENPPLARELYTKVGIDEMIPEELYGAVAQILSQVYEILQNILTKDTTMAKNRQNNQDLQKALKLHRLEIHLGYQLLNLVDPNDKYGDLKERLKNMRKKIAGEFGFIVPKIKISENSNLELDEYRIVLKGADIGGSKLKLNKLLALDTGTVLEEIEGIATKDPTSNTDALWIEDNEDTKKNAIMKGYTVLEPTAILTTHLEELIKRYMGELLTIQDVQNLLDDMREDHPVLINLIKEINICTIHSVLKELLRAKIPIKDRVTIMETIAKISYFTMNADIITQEVRNSLSRTITNMYKDDSNTLNFLMFSTQSEQFLLDKVVVRENDAVDLLLDNDEIANLIEQSQLEIQKLVDQGITPAIIFTDPKIRKTLSDLYTQMGVKVIVVAHSEIDKRVNFNVLGSIDLISEDEDIDNLI